MSAIARERRRRRATRLHAVLPHSNGANWQAVLVIGVSLRASATPTALNRATRALTGAGWQTAQRDEGDGRVLIAARELPVATSDDHPHEAAVAFLAALAAVDGEELTSGVTWLEDVILVPPGAIDSDTDLLWLDPAGDLESAWQQRTAEALGQAGAALAGHWRAQGGAASHPQSLADSLF